MRLADAPGPDWRSHCAAVVPCYNEAGRIGSVVATVRRHVPSVLVIDDGSGDDTAGEAAAAGAEVIRISVNGGKGAALRHGWQEARSRGFDWAVTLDGDGQHSAADIPRFFDCVNRTGVGLVVGNRMNEKWRMPTLRRWTNQWMSRRLSRLTGSELPDSQCGFRLIHLETALQLPLAARRFEIESETLVAFLAAGKGVQFVPIEVIYNSSRSRISPVRDGFRWLRWWTARAGLPPNVHGEGIGCQDTVAAPSRPPQPVTNPH